MAQPLISPLNFEPRADIHVGSGCRFLSAQPWEDRDLTGLTAGYSLVFAIYYADPSPGCVTLSCLNSDWSSYLATDGILEPRIIMPVLRASQPPDYGHILDELKSTLDVTLSHVARCLRLQRSAVYKWYQGATPHASNRARIEVLQEFSRAWRVARLSSLQNYWDSRVPGGQETLGKLLTGESLDLPLLRSAVRALAGHPAAERAPRLGFPDRKRDRARDREWLETTLPSTSREDEG